MNPRVDTVAALFERIHAALADLQAAAAALKDVIGSAPDAAQHEEYLDIRELVARIPFQEQTIRNLMSQGELREGDHYLQRVKGGRVIFVWSRMEHWLRDGSNNSEFSTGRAPLKNIRRGACP